MTPVTIVTIIMFIISIFLIVIGFLLSPYSNSFSGALVGSSDLELFNISKEKGYKKFLKWSMILGGLTLLIVAVLVRVYA